MKNIIALLVLFALLPISGCKTIPPAVTPTVVGTHAVSAPIPTVTVEQINTAASGMAALTDSSRTSAGEIKGKSSEIGAAVVAAAEGSATPQQVAKDVVPKTERINVLSDTIAKDQDLLRRKIADGEAEVLKMKKENDRLVAENKVVMAAYEADLKNLDVKYKGELSARDVTIKDLQDQIEKFKAEIAKLNSTVREILTGSFRVVIYFGIAFIIGGLAMLYFLADKMKGAGAVVIGMIAVALGGMLPSMVDAASKAGVWAVWGIFGAGAAYAVYLLIIYARSQKTNEQLFKTNVILGKKDATLLDEATKEQIDLVQDATTRSFVAAGYKLMGIAPPK